MNTIGNRVFRLRKRLGLTRETVVAKIPRMTVYCLYLIETGRTRNPTLATIRNLATVLDTSVDYLITGRNSVGSENR
jgi:transcriptional regulator with XRE-family HTH domain